MKEESNNKTVTNNGMASFIAKLDHISMKKYEFEPTGLGLLS